MHLIEAANFSDTQRSHSVVIAKRHPKPKGMQQIDVEFAFVGVSEAVGCARGKLLY